MIEFAESVVVIGISAFVALWGVAAVVYAIAFAIRVFTSERKRK